MSRKSACITVILSVGLLLAACTSVPPSPTPVANMPNPVSVFCEEHGGKVVLRQDASGGVVGICIFPDGSECDEWAYFRGECSPGQGATTPLPVPNMPNPASVFCEEHGGKVDLRQDASGAVTGMCIFPDGSECDEWAYFRGECGPGQGGVTPTPTAAVVAVTPTTFPTPLPIDPADYQGWWTYKNPGFGFSLRLPIDWIVGEVTTGDARMNGHLLTLRPQDPSTGINIRMAFRRSGEETLLWPTGVGAGEFVVNGVLDVAGQPARRMLFVCPAGQVGSIWYQGESTPNIQRGELEFSFIFGFENGSCPEERSLDGKVQRVGEMIIASMQVP